MVTSKLRMIFSRLPADAKATGFSRYVVYSACYLLPHNESYAKKASYFGKFHSIDALLDHFWNLGSFFVLSIFIFNKQYVLAFLKDGYEAVPYQHPYSAMALAMLKEGLTVELINTPLLKVQSGSANARFDMITAYIDVVNTVRPYLRDDQFNKYLKRDFYPARERTVFSLDIGITKGVSLNRLTYNYKRLISLVPFCSRVFFKSLLWMGFIHVRRCNKLISVMVYFLSRLNKSKFSSMNYNDIYICVCSNLQTESLYRH